ncbi:MAG TPA: hypothetical protein VNP71_07030 [Thermoplasmata archaeon]|nr:hypothetical protein [Thermoplasmata archaeon]
MTPAAATVAPVPPVPPPQAPFPPYPAQTPPFVPPQAPPGSWPGPYYPPPKKKHTALIAVLAIVIVIIVIAVVAVLLIHANAKFVSINKTGVSGGNMTFDVTIHTEGTSISVDRLHVNIRSLQNGVDYDAVYFYNVDTIPAGRTFTWGVDIRVDPANLSAFRYEFTLEVNGAIVDTAAVV